MMRSKSLQHDQSKLGQLTQETNKSINKQTNNKTAYTVYKLSCLNKIGCGNARQDIALQLYSTNKWNNIYMNMVTPFVLVQDDHLCTFNFANILPLSGVVRNLPVRRCEQNVFRLQVCMSQPGNLEFFTRISLRNTKCKFKMQRNSYDLHS